MPFKIVVTKTAKKDIRKLDMVVRKKVRNKIFFYSQKPTAYAEPLSGKELGDYRWRMGKIRVTFDLHNKTIIILRIRYRKEVYK